MKDTHHDPYPATLNIEIDRPRLKTYLRFNWYRWWLVPLVLIGGVIGFSTIANALNAGELQRSEIPWIILRHVGVGMATGAALATLCYFVFSHFTAARYADSLEVSVEGPFLRVRQHFVTRSDRKLHFRSIIDYATTQDFLMRLLGIEALLMTTTAAGPSAFLSIPAVKDALGARDLLADIDRLREVNWRGQTKERRFPTAGAGAGGRSPGSAVFQTATKPAAKPLLKCGDAARCALG